MTITKRHRIAKIEEVLNIRTELHVKDYDNSLDTTFKVSRESNGSFIYDGIYSKSDLIEECNK